MLQGQPLHPIKHALQIFTDASKEGWGALLNEHTARGTWFLPESKLHINYLELKAVFLAFKEAQVDPFATRFNYKLPQFVSMVPGRLAWAVDALGLPWEDLDPYAFPPVATFGKVVEKLQDYPYSRIILIAPWWPWFWDLVAMSSHCACPTCPIC